MRFIESPPTLRDENDSHIGSTSPWEADQATPPPDQPSDDLEGGPFAHRCRVDRPRGEEVREVGHTELIRRLRFDLSVQALPGPGRPTGQARDRRLPGSKAIRKRPVAEIIETVKPAPA